MTQAHGKDFNLWLGKYAVAAYYRQAEVSDDIEMADVTTATLEDHVFLPGVTMGGINLEGVYDSAHVVVLDDFAKTAGGEPVIFTPAAAALNGRAKMMVSKQQRFSQSSPVADAVAFVYQAQAHAGLDHGRILHLGAETAADSEASTDWAASSADGGAAYLSVTDFTGVDLVVIVEHSTNDSTWATLATFTTVTAATAERVVVAAGTTVNRYLRATWSTPGGFTSATFALGFARR